MTVELDNSMDERSSLTALVQIKEHSLALLFANYLVTQGVEAQVNEIDGSFVVFCAENKCNYAKAEFEAFIQQPHAEKYQQAAWQSSEVVEVRDGSESLLSSFKQNFLAHAGIVTLSVFSVCWLIFIASNLGWAQAIFSRVQFFPNLSVDAFFSEPLRLLGPAFFHFSLLHIVFNTMWWWQLGGSIEKVLGKGTLINLFLLSAIASNVGQYLVSGPNFGGLSGVVYALVGFVWWYGYLAPEKGLSLSKPIIGFLLFWLVLGFADLLPVNIANTAHLLGLLSGCFFAVLNVKFLRKV